MMLHLCKYYSTKLILESKLKGMTFCPLFHPLFAYRILLELVQVKVESNEGL